MASGVSSPQEVHNESPSRRSCLLFLGHWNEHYRKNFFRMERFLKQRSTSRRDHSYPVDGRVFQQPAHPALVG